MEDRQPTRPGRVAITDELTGETRYATIEMADEPTEEGTPPIKPNLFDDTTQARYPAGTSTVNLALRQTVLLSDKATEAEAAAGTDDTKWMTPQKVQQAVGDKVGDLRISKRSSLGDKYLLCNGAKVDISQYPDLVPYLTQKQFYQMNNSTTVNVSNNDGLMCLALFKGNFVVGGYTKTTNYPVIYYKPVGGSSFIRKQLSTTIGYPNNFATDGEAIAFATFDSSILKIYYSTDLTSWSTKNLQTDLVAYNSPYIKYDNGVWYIYTQDGSTVFFASSLTGTWTRKNLNGYNKQLVNGYFSGWYTGYSSSGNSIGLYFDKFTGTNAPKNDYLDKYFASADNYWTISSYQNYIVVLGKASVTSNVGYYVHMLYFDKSKLDNYTSGRISITDKTIVSSDYGRPIGLFQQGAYWIIPLYDNTNKYLRIYGTTGDPLTGTYSQLGSVSLTNIVIRDLYYNVVFSREESGRFAVLDNNTIKYSDPGYFLPTISVPGANTFIRAKE